MITYKKNYQIAPADISVEKDRLICQAEEAMTRPIPHITDTVAPLSEGTVHDFYSNGDYWWPNPETPDGLPYIQRDGETNPENFIAHRMAMRQMRTDVVSLAAAYSLTGEEKYAAFAVRMLFEFFLDRRTCMNPNLEFAQAIPGVCRGRGIGIIDTLHLVEVPYAIERLKGSEALTEEIYNGLKTWFSDYLDWMLTSENGQQEMDKDNNHGVCFFVQAAAFALFTDATLIVEFCRKRYKEVLLRQMADDGSFPKETARTKPYNYSIFVVDNMVTLCHLLSTPTDNLWTYTDPEGHCIAKGLDFLTPYLQDKSKWPFRKDVMYFDNFPARTSFMLFAGCMLGRQELLDLYQQLPYPFEPEEVSRNNAIQEPALML